MSQFADRIRAPGGVDAFIDTHGDGYAELAVPSGRIAAVGDEGDVAALIGPGTRVVDTLRHRVIPGLNDSHIHRCSPPSSDPATSSVYRSPTLASASASEG